MLSADMRVAYKRVLVFCLLCVCLGVFSSTPAKSANSSICIQDCLAREAMCHDNCDIACSTTDENCNTCMANCDTQLEMCMGNAINCSAGTMAYSPRCTVGYADHCPIINGEPNCKDERAHSGYYQICTNIGGGQCVSCPGGERCVGANGLQPCF